MEYDEVVSKLVFVLPVLIETLLITKDVGIEVEVDESIGDEVESNKTLLNVEVEEASESFLERKFIQQIRNDCRIK